MAGGEISSRANGETRPCPAFKQPSNGAIPEHLNTAPTLDLTDRDALELQMYPAERVLARLQPDAGHFELFKHKLLLLTQNARVDPHACRDHLANERTFLGWVRTSISLAIVGTVIAQLFRLQHTPSPNPIFGFYKLGVPLASICHGSALAIVVAGAHRFRKQQKNMILGRYEAGGPEILFVGTLVTLILTTLFILLVAIDVDKSGS